MAFIVVYVTYPSRKEAHRITDALLEKRLIACANIFPAESKYRWKGKLEERLEIVSVMKAPAANWARIKAQILRLHPYEVPDITRMSAQANPGYERWIREEAKGRRRK
jgi:periplasmic divalent cation tolerance protein